MNIDPHLVSLIVISVLLLFGSSIFSASETALFSLDRVQIDRVLHRKSIVYRCIYYVLSRPQRLMITIIAGNEVCNVALAAYTADFLHSFLKGHRLQEWGPLVNLVLVTPMVLIFAEITPKVLALRNNEIVAKLYAVPIFLFFQIITPVRMVLLTITKVLFKILRVPPQKDRPLTEEEFLVMIDQSRSAGHLNVQDQELVQNVFEFTEHRCGEIMTPLEKAFMLEAKTPLAEAVKLFSTEAYSRMPIYDGARENIVGIVYAMDLLRARSQRASQLKKLTLRDVMRPPFFASPSWSVNRMFKEMKRNRRHMVIVHKEPVMNEAKKEAWGIVTLEDVVEELFGNIQDERDKDESGA